MARNTKAARSRLLPKKKPTPLTERALGALKKHGPGTSDAIARRVGASSRATGKALSALKQRRKAYFTRRGGENIWRKGAARTR